MTAICAIAGVDAICSALNLVPSGHVFAACDENWVRCTREWLSASGGLITLVIGILTVISLRRQIERADHHHRANLKLADQNNRDNLRLQMQEQYDCAKEVAKLSRQGVALANEFLAEAKGKSDRDVALVFANQYRHRFRRIIQGQAYNYFGDNFFYSDPANVTIGWLRRYLHRDFMKFYRSKGPSISGPSARFFVWRYRRLHRIMWRTSKNFMKRADDLVGERD
ncbi:hypothetical protein ACLE20_06900 [Rhizobium sp. YIM 134829]|uniref:hypothetical protein n=1 Tax=Rhizobium sp. YIM 134829 TaxID=3390453 RepID=UPI00397DC5AF